jgi:DNA-binding HxlR family transcriptional regulator
MKKTNGKRSPCPLACTLDLIGDKWTLLVVRDLALGKTQFNEFLRSPEGIATNILTDRLGRLVENGLVERHMPDDHRTREVYRLTPKGITLVPVLKMIAQWGLAHIEGTAALLSKTKL